jgi:DNA-binding XRE family transcriptional regulator
MIPTKLTLRTIRKVFELSGYTQARFAKAVNARREQVNLWLNGRSHPNLNHIKRITRLAAKHGYYIIPDLTQK